MAKPRRNQSESAEPAAPKAAAIGDNVKPEVSKRHASTILRLTSELKAVQQKIKTAWDAAESDGIVKKPFKAVLKLASDDPAALELYLRQFQQYTVQLGLFDRIEAWKQAEDTADNAASVDAAERQAAHPKAVEPLKDQTLDACNQQGVQAGLDGADASSNPYPEGSEKGKAWDHGYHGGSRQRRVNAGSVMDEVERQQA